VNIYTFLAIPNLLFLIVREDSKISIYENSPLLILCKIWKSCGLSEEFRMIKLTRLGSYADKLRTYKIFIDGVYQGGIKANETTYFTVSKGKHIIYAKIDWCRSNKLQIDVEDTVLELEIGSSLEGYMLFFIILYITIFKNRYLWIRKKDCKNNIFDNEANTP
jgi:hypothetical protein